MGNPPYVGARLQERKQKEDMEFVFKGINGFNNLDYIACWFYKGSQYIQKSIAKYAFVSTNSVCQGEQVPLLWPEICFGSMPNDGGALLLNIREKDDLSLADGRSSIFIRRFGCLEY